VKLLLVEDEEHLAFNLSLNLGDEGFEVIVAKNLAEADAAMAQRPALIVLDLMLPDGNGLDFCAGLRTRGNRTPVLMLTAMGSADSIVEGLGSGADDYLPKPFELAELIGRIRALLRRRAWDASPTADTPANTLAFGGATVHFDTHMASVAGKTFELTELEIRLLRFFIEHENRVVSRAQLLENVWEVSPRTHTRTVDNFMVRLRRLFEKDPARPVHFVTVRGVGYRFVQVP